MKNNYCISDILQLQQTRCSVKCKSKKSVLELISTIAAEQLKTVKSSIIFDSLIKRERLGSTSIGHGVAIPHGRCQQASNVIATLLQLKKPIDFDQDDQQPVDIIFALIIPEHTKQEHLTILATLAEIFSDTGYRNALRLAQTPSELYQKAIDYYA